MLLRIKEFIKNLKERLEFQSKLKQGTPVLIYQMGKVGSSSIYHPLKKLYPGHVIHIHQFNEKCWYWDAREMYKLFSNGKQKKFKVITLIREPIGRNLSEFFHRFKMYNNNIDFTENQLSIEELKENFLKNLDQDYPIHWFDENIKKHFDIDVFSKPFSTSGYDYYSNNDVEVLLMKHDLPNDLKDKLIADFLNISNFKQEIRNVGENKVYKNAYAQFKREVKLPEDYLQKMANSKYFKHFYSLDFIEKTISTWRA